MTLPLAPDDVRALTSVLKGIDAALQLFHAAVQRDHRAGADRGSLRQGDDALQHDAIQDGTADLAAPQAGALNQSEVTADLARQLLDQGQELADVVANLRSLSAHIDSSSVVPDVAPSGGNATVGAPGDTVRPDSPRRVVGSPDSITIRSTSGTAPIAFVRSGGLLRIDLEDGSSQVYPARDLAAWLIDVADQAEAVTR